MRTRLSPLACSVAVAALLVATTGRSGSGIAQAPRGRAVQKPGVAQLKKSQLRAGLTPLQRLEKSLARSPRQDLLTPVVVHSIERYLRGATDLSDMDRIVRRALLRHPISREMLQTWVANWKAIPPATKARFVPVEVRNLDPAQRLNMGPFRAAVQRAAAQATRSTRVEWGSARAVLGATLDTTPTTRRPHITGLAPLDPEGVPAFRSGQTLTINGKNFSNVARHDQIHLLKYAAPPGADPRQAPRLQIVRTLWPTIATPTGLRTEIPAVWMGRGSGPGGRRSDYIERGRYWVQVETSGYGKSNLVPCEIEPAAQLPPPTVITSFEPAAQYPGQTVVIRGSNFPSPEFLWFESIDYEGVSYHWVPAQSVSSTELRLTLPQDFLPGTYRISANGARAWSVGKNFTVRAPLYRVTFNTIKCLDESDPEANCSDEIVTMWTIAADGNVWTKQTGEYDGFDDDDQQDYLASDRTVFSPDGPAREVRQFLFIRSAVYEWDYGVAAAGETVFGFCGELLGAMYDYLGEGTLAVGLFVVVPLGVVGLIGELVDTIVNWFGGDPDPLGKIPIAWSAVQLQLQTANPSRSFSNVLDFNNDDDTGSYRLHYTVIREEPR